jgi:hypothetical protein
MSVRAAVVGLALVFAVAPQAHAAGRGRRPAPAVVIATGPLHVLSDRHEFRAHLRRAQRLVDDSLRRTAHPRVVNLLDNARNRLDNVCEYLGLELPDRDEPVVIPKEGREADASAADAVVSGSLIVADLESLHHDLGRAEYNLAQAAGAVARHNPALEAQIAEARAEVSVARELLDRRVGLAPAPAPVSPPAPPPGPAPVPVTTAPGGLPPPTPGAFAVITEDELRSLLDALSRESWADDRLRVLSSFAPNRHFTVAQVLSILRKFDFAHHRLRAISILRSGIVDPVNHYQLYALFQFPAEKEELQRILAGSTPAPAPVPAPSPLSNEEFQALVARMRVGYTYDQWLRTLQDESPRFWFLVDHVAALAGSFPSPELRFGAIGILRPRILDPQNAPRLEALFLTEAERTRLRQIFGR